MQLRLLRLFLGFAAFAWGISVVGVFASWVSPSERGLQPASTRKLLWTAKRHKCRAPRLAGAFALIGGWYLVLMLWPQKFHAAIPWFGALMLVEGLILLIHGLRLSLPPFPFYGDVSACFLGGAGILFMAHHAKPE